MFALSARNTRKALAEGREPKCARCRGHASKPSTVTAAHLRWWRRRFTDVELVQLAEAAFGPRETWPEGRWP